jgi:hypothetical protein
VAGMGWREKHTGFWEKLKEGDLLKCLNWRIILKGDLKEQNGNAWT